MPPCRHAATHAGLVQRHRRYHDRALQRPLRSGAPSGQRAVHQLGGRPAATHAAHAAHARAARARGGGHGACEHVAGTAAARLWDRARGAEHQRHGAPGREQRGGGQRRRTVRVGASLDRVGAAARLRNLRTPHRTTRARVAPAMFSGKCGGDQTASPRPRPPRHGARLPARPHGGGCHAGCHSRPTVGCHAILARYPGGTPANYWDWSCAHNDTCCTLKSLAEGKRGACSTFLGAFLRAFLRACSVRAAAAGGAMAAAGSPFTATRPSGGTGRGRWRLRVTGAAHGARLASLMPLQVAGMAR